MAIAASGHQLVPGFNSLSRRQSSEPCIAECGIFYAALECNTTGCICADFNAGGSAAVSNCTNCLQSASPPLASNITLFAQVCTNCSTQCDTTLAGYIATLSCNTTACECAYYAAIGAPNITTCANCIQPFAPADAAGVIEFAQACGVIPTNSSVSTSASASLSSASASASAKSGSPSATSTSIGNRKSAVDVFAMMSCISLALVTFLIFLFM